MEGQRQDRDFVSLFTSADVMCHVKCSQPAELLHVLLDRIAQHRDIDFSLINRGELVQRIAESQIPLVHGVAIPHARLDGIDSLGIALATSEAGFRFETEGERAHMVVLILAPRESPAMYLETIGALSEMCRGRNISGGILKYRSSRAAYRFLSRNSFQLPDFVRAEDIMNPSPVTLKETDTLETAIDYFTSKHLVNLPVVDRAGDLVGVVTAYELLRICLPDYILWMEDVSPIIDFEPFADVLRRERQTWLTDVMSDDYAVVQAEAPAIDVAKEISKHRTRDAFVLRNKKLIGYITLQQFLNKVLRE